MSTKPKKLETEPAAMPPRPPTRPLSALACFVVLSIALVIFAVGVGGFVVRALLLYPARARNLVLVLARGVSDEELFNSRAYGGGPGSAPWDRGYVGGFSSSETISRVTPEDQRLLEWARNSGKVTGIVTTGRVTSPSVAEFSTPNATGALAPLLVPGQVLLLGGGSEALTPQNADQLDALGASVLGSVAEWLETPTDTLDPKPVVGLLVPGEFPFRIDVGSGAGTPPALVDLTTWALEYMREAGDRALGFVLVVEAALPAHAVQCGDAGALAHEMADFYATLGAVAAFIEGAPETAGVFVGVPSPGTTTVFDREVLKDVGKNTMSVKAARTLADGGFRHAGFADRIMRAFRLEDTSLYARTLTNLADSVTTTQAEMSAHIANVYKDAYGITYTQTYKGTHKMPVAAVFNRAEAPHPTTNLTTYLRGLLGVARER